MIIDNKKVILIVIIIFSGLLLLGREKKDENTKLSGYIDVDGGKLYYDIIGNGKPIIFLHNGMIHSVVWDGQIGEFSKQYKTICYDRRGYGKSPQTESEYSNVEDLNTLLEELEIKRANLIGMSAGARISIDFAMQYPEKVSSLVLVGPVVSGFSFTRHFFLRGGHATIDILNDPKAFLNYMFTDDPYSIYRENKEARLKALAILKENLQNFDRQKFRLNRDLNLNSVSKLNNIKVPTLIISGEFDIPDVHAHSGAINAAIPNSRRVVVNEAAHLVPFERPQIFNEYVIGFYKNIKLISMIEKKGVEFVVEFYMKKINENPDEKYFTEERLNELGYKYLYEGRVVEAIELFKLNVAGYPKSSNVYDSLGEAYMEKGERELAIKNYEKSLELNPENQNAVIKLEVLRDK